MDDAPLMLTLRLDEASFARLDAERRVHFPPERNLVPAHLTLFHHLPGRLLGSISDRLTKLAADHSPMVLSVSGLRFLGQGTAYTIESAVLERLRAGLAGHWAEHLTRQDSHGFRPHVTIQNKVPAASAKNLFESLSSSFTPFEAMGTGLLLWRYRQGPWQPAGEYPFSA